jgi:hypothetical protein
MKAPKCRLCGKEHWSHEPHVFEETGSRKPREREAARKEPGAPVHKAEGLESVVAGTTQNRRKRADYNAYQRQYMKQAALVSYVTGSM